MYGKPLRIERAGLFSPGASWETFVVPELRTMAKSTSARPRGDEADPGTWRWLKEWTGYVVTVLLRKGGDLVDLRRVRPGRAGAP
jgi:hypothetical protein